MTSLATLAALCNGDLIGDGEVDIIGVSTIEKPQQQHISYISNQQLLQYIVNDANTAYIVPRSYAEKINLGIVVDNPTQAFRIILEHLYPRSNKPSIANTAIISKSAHIGKNVSIGDYAVIKENVIINDDCIIDSHVIIHPEAVIGKNTHVGNHCVIHNSCTLGSQCVIADGVIIGGQGFGFSREPSGWHAIPQIGAVKIGNSVHIGANSCIDRGAINDTIIGNNVIIDNLVHIAHNVQIGDHTAMAACVGIAGSTTVGKNCLLAGQVGIVGHITIADNVHINGGARVLQSIKEPGTYAGSFNALPAKKWNRIAAYIKKLETLFTKRKHSE